MLCSKLHSTNLRIFSAYKISSTHRTNGKLRVTTQKAHARNQRMMLERLRENLADFVRNISRIQENLYQDVNCDLSI